MTSVLVLGGTHFLGYAVADDALARGWKVTALHGGRHTPPVGVESIVADRTKPGALEGLSARGWDLVVDTWSGEPQPVRDSVAALTDRVGSYAFVSSRSVYAWPAADGADENAPLVTLPATGEEFDYAQAKRAAEDVVRETLGERAVIARAGLLLGPREGPGRLPWWLGRIARGGTVPVPGPENLDLQYADARDLAAWLLDAGFRGTPGVFNVVGPIAGTTMAEIVDLCRDITGAEARFRWIDPGVIETAGIEPWTELPMWLPPGDSHAAMHRGDVTALMRTGFAQRALRDTIADTWAWMNTDEGRLALAGKRFGLSDEQEEALLVGQA